jgi:hypothetical protein
VEFPPDWQQSALDTFSLSHELKRLSAKIRRAPYHPNSIATIVRRIIYLMLVIVARPVI